MAGTPAAEAISYLAGAANSHDVLIGTIVSASLAFILGLFTTYYSRNRATTTPPTEDPPVAGSGVTSYADMKKDRDEWKKRYELEASIAQDLETMCWEAQLNPAAIIRRRNPRGRA